MGVKYPRVISSSGNLRTKFQLIYPRFRGPAVQWCCRRCYPQSHYTGNRYGGRPHRNLPNINLHDSWKQITSGYSLKMNGRTDRQTDKHTDERTDLPLLILRCKASFAGRCKNDENGTKREFWHRQADLKKHEQKLVRRWDIRTRHRTILLSLLRLSPRYKMAEKYCRKFQPPSRAHERYRRQSHCEVRTP